MHKIGAETSFLKLLCNEIYPNTTEYTALAINLGIEAAEIRRIYRNNHTELECFVAIMEAWHRRGTPPFTWETILEALELPSVDEQTLANDLRQKYAVERR